VVSGVSRLMRGETKATGASRRMCRSPCPSRLAISAKEAIRPSLMSSIQPREHQGCSTGTPTVTLCLQRKSSILCEKICFVGCFGRGEQVLVATSSTLPKGAFQNDICWFESSMPSHPVQSLLCDFPVCENRRHFRDLGWRTGVSGRHILGFQGGTAGLAAPVSARLFPISVSARRRPVRYVTETGLRSRISPVK